MSSISLATRRAGFQPLQTFGRLLERRIDLERLAEVGNRAGLVGQPLADQPAGGESAGRAGVERNGAVGIGKRLDVFTAEIMRPGAIIVGECCIRRKLDGARIVGHGIAEIEPFALGVAAVDVGVGKPRIELDGLVEVGNGPLRFALCGPGTAPVVEGGGRGIQLMA